MSRWDHAQVQRKVINNDNGGQPLVCCWDDCTRPGYECFKHISCEHDVRNMSCSYADRQALAHSGRTAHTNYVFCTQRHRNYWVNATGGNAHESIARTGRAYGNLPVGMRRMIG